MRRLGGIASSMRAKSRMCRPHSSRSCVAASRSTSASVARFVNGSILLVSTRSVTFFRIR